MFKIAQLQKVNNEVININVVNQLLDKFVPGGKVVHKSFKSLSFSIGGQIGDKTYNLSFYLNCSLNKLLTLPYNDKIDFNKYILDNDTWFTIEGLQSMAPQISVKIIRYLENKFIIFLTFYTEYNYDVNVDYSGMIEITFDLDDYLDK